jgi:hypothetical protein
MNAQHSSMNKILKLSFPLIAALVLTGCTDSESPSTDSSEIYTTEQDGLGRGSPSEQFDWNQGKESTQEKTNDPFDADGDGIPDFADVDPGGDGFVTAPSSGEMNPPFDADGDGVPNEADWDKDGDGIAD